MTIKREHFFLNNQSFPTNKRGKKPVPANKLINVAQQYFAIVDVKAAMDAGYKVIATGSVNPCVVLFMWVRSKSLRDYLCLAHIDSSAADGTLGFSTTNLIPALTSKMHAMAGESVGYRGAVLLTGGSPDKSSARIITCARALLKAKRYDIPGQALCMTEKTSSKWVDGGYKDVTTLRPVANKATAFGMLLNDGQHIQLKEEYYTINAEESYQKSKKQNFVSVGRLDDNLTVTKNVQIVGSGYNTVCL